MRKIPSNILEILSSIEGKMEVVLHALFHMLLKEYTLMAHLDTLTASVAKNGDVVQSAIVLLRGLKAQLDEAGTNPVSLAELSAALDSHSDELAEAVVANTPSA